MNVAPTTALILRLLSVALHALPPEQKNWIMPRHATALNVANREPGRPTIRVRSGQREYHPAAHAETVRVTMLHHLQPCHVAARTGWCENGVRAVLTSL